MARIYLDARAATSRASGIGRYADQLVAECARQAPAHEFIVIHSTHTAGACSSSAIRNYALPGPTGSLGLLLSNPLVGSLFDRVGRPDIYHALFHVVPYGIRRGHNAPSRVVVTLHDVIWIDHAEQVVRSAPAAAWRRTLGSVVIPYALRQADHVICNSAVTADDAARWVPRARCSVVHMGVGGVFVEDQVEATTSLAASPPYLTAFGQNKPYKNIVTVVRALAVIRHSRPDVTLALIGGDGGAQDEIARLGLRDVVRVVRDISDDGVRHLIRGAAAHIVPSLVEGFGLPVLEAMALGTPVITSTAAALREVAADAALVFPSTDAQSLAACVSTLLADGELRLDLVRRGHARASQFTWARAAAKTLAVYDQVLTQASPSEAGT